MAHERLSLDQEHDGTLAPGQAMTDIETALRTRIEEWNAHILGPGLTQWGIDDLAFILAALVQGMLQEREQAAAKWEQRAVRYSHTVTEQAREIETLKADLQVAQEIGDSFWLAIKLLNLPRINVSNPGAHVTELILEIERLRELAKKMTNMMLQAVVNETTAPWEQLVNDIRATLRATPEAGG